MSPPDLILDRLEALRLVSRAGLESRLRQLGNDPLALLDDLAHEFPRERGRLGRIWGDHIGVAYVDLESTIIQPEAVAKVPRAFAERNQVVPLYEIGEVVTLASTQPRAPGLENLASNELGLFASFVFSLPGEIHDAIQIAYQSQDSLAELLKSNRLAGLTEAATGLITTAQIEKLAGDQAIIEFGRQLLLLALHEEASDIHLEPGEFNARVRFRIDGALQERFVIERAMLLPLASRIKILAGADIAERRLPQDGRIKLELLQRSIDLRFSSIPTIYGEKIVLRILGQAKKRGIPDLSTLDFSTSVLDNIKRVSRSPNGVFFITGPTGSGKTTTLYSILQSINSPEINILTVEDPVEYCLPGANQVQVNTAINLDFTAALRAFLRQDPNVILIGEIRDIESARIAAQAALTGHLVLATLHTNNSLQTISRLIQIGVEPFLVAPSLVAVMAQRLVRRICPHCKERYPAPPEKLARHFLWDGQTEVFFWRGQGCHHCHRTGYLGRMGIHEIFIINKPVREMIANNASILQIEACAIENGFKPLRYDGLKKVIRGLTTIEELERVTYSEFE